MLQASFSIVDQVMVGSMGSVSVAAVGIAGKLSTLYSVVIGAVVSVAGIIISQYHSERMTKRKPTADFRCIR